MSEDVKNIVQNAIQSSLNALAEPIFTEIGVQRAKLGSCFFPYTKYSLERCLSFRTMDSPHFERALNEFYVHPSFKRGMSVFSHEFIVQEINSLKRLIISGKGGSGKTVFLKYLFLQLMDDQNSGLPLLIELRKLNRGDFASLSELCRHSLDLVDGVNGSVFSTLCKRGYFSFIFDGFDEVSRTKRLKVETELLELARLYPRCRYVVSGRKNIKFSAWEGFSQYEIADLSEQGVAEVIDKSTIAGEIKKRIKVEMNEMSFFETHKSLLATPLLVTMFILTYKRTSRLPSLLSNFFPQVFENFVFLHDSSNKETFARDYSMSTEQFRRFFSIFCLTSYIKETYEFDDHVLGETIQYAAVIGAKLDVLSGISDLPISEIKVDLCEAANLLIYDDGVHIFLHRSMQEFFAAEAALLIGATKLTELLRRFASRKSDSTFRFAFEINEGQVVQNFFCSEIKRFSEEIDVLTATPHEILNSLRLSSEIFVRRYENGQCRVETEFRNRELFSLFVALDLVKEEAEGIDTLQCELAELLQAEINFNAPRGFIESEGLRFKLDWSSDKPPFKMFDLNQDKNAVKDREKLIETIIKRLSQTFVQNKPKMINYLETAQIRLRHLIESNSSLVDTLDVLLEP